MSHFLISGGKGGATQGAVAPNRREINDLVKDTDQFSLYIQALTAMFTTPQSNPLSQFGIGGIHGLPYVQWEGSGGTRPVQGSQWGGYCTHGNVLFPTWHRPYVALYEQVMQQHALDISQQYQDQQRWSSAAQNLRAPYWDWATNVVPPPEVISLQTVDITTPDGNTTTVPNPLYQYTFNPIDSSFPAPYEYWQTTIRHPDNPNSPDATTDVQALTDDLSSVQSDITQSTYNLLSRVNTWPGFSNHTPGDGGSSSNSLEAIHDEIHGTIGGQMGDPSVAGFDPIFFLHHCNVDRMLSLWAAVNPGVWVSKGPAEGGTFTISGNASIDAKTTLTPFWETQTTYWLSTQATATGNFKYSYPEFNGLDLGNPDAVQAAIGNYINQQYGGGSLSLFQGGAPISLFAQPAAGGAQAPATGHSGSPITEAVSAVKSATSDIARQFHSRGGNPHTAQKPEHGKEGPKVLNDWTVRIHFKKYELGGSFAVLIFLGQVPDDPSQWRTAPTFVGSHHAFVNSAASQCDNCREQADLVVEGFVHLNSAIAERSGLSSFDPSVVIPYLKANLQWRIQAADRTGVESSRLPSLEVTVVSTPLTHAPGSIFPIPGDAHYHHQITHGRPGGAHHL
ncbi:photo-regulated tyrosinase [Russula emetica]|nr:photo-regulated tyrosinase [Russula emetica]